MTLIESHTNEITILEGTKPVDISPGAIAELIQKIKQTGLDKYDPDISERRRASRIGVRRPFITALDERLVALKEMYPSETRNAKGHRQPNPGYRRASYSMKEYRKQISRVQKADRLTLIGRI